MKNFIKLAPIILVVCISCHQQQDNQQESPGKPLLNLKEISAQECTKLKGRILNNLSGNESCNQDESSSKIIGMDCPCICCYKKGIE